MYGDYKGTKLETAWDTVGTLPKALKLLPQPQQGGNQNARQDGDQQVPDHQGIENVRGNVRPSETQGRQTRSKGLTDSTVDTSGIKQNVHELRNLGVTIEPKNVDEKVDNDENEPTGPEQQEDAAAQAIGAFVLIDKFNERVEDVLPDMACRVQEVDYEKMDPARYKDIFKNPDNFDEAWNHECSFQRKKW